MVFQYEGRAFEGTVKSDLGKDGTLSVTDKGVVKMNWKGSHRCRDADTGGDIDQTLTGTILGYDKGEFLVKFTAMDWLDDGTRYDDPVDKWEGAIDKTLKFELHGRSITVLTHDFETIGDAVRSQISINEQ
eukprot:UN4644